MKVTNIISVFICGIILIWSGPAYSEDQADQSSSVPIEFEGYYKSLFTQSRSLATKENFYSVSD
ncbi:MAG: hypothetical protein KC618_00500 [Candidatus Omnitrophica bacterium]|nr:hypothetical protein [Candidatus Omnitrophota bacterium]